MTHPSPQGRREPRSMSALHGLARRARPGLAVLATLAVLAAPPVLAKRATLLGEVEGALASAVAPGSVTVPATGTIEVAFSPNEGSEALVVKVIDAAKSELRLLAYSFTSAPVTAALLRAKQRGVDVALVVDAKNNLSEDRSGKARAALNALATAGIRVRTISVYPIHHDKSVCADQSTVETGSFNFSSSAASKNSENVLVHWGNPKLAAVYLKHWARNWEQGVPYQPAY